jgi:hypothetical protein
MPCTCVYAPLSNRRLWCACVRPWCTNLCLYVWICLACVFMHSPATVILEHTLPRPPSHPHCVVVAYAHAHARVSDLLSDTLHPCVHKLWHVCTSRVVCARGPQHVQTQRYHTFRGHTHLRTPPLLCIRRCQLPGVALATRQTGRILNRPRNHSHASKNSPAQCAAQRCSMMRSRSLVDNNKRRVQHDCDCCSGGRRRRRVGCAFLWGASGVLHHSGGHQPHPPHAAVRYRTQRPTTRLHPLFVHTQLGSWGSFAVSSTCTFCCSDFCGQIQPRACNRTCPPPPSSFVARAIPSRGNYSTVTDSRNHVAACNAHSICRVQKSNAACA